MRKNVDAQVVRDFGAQWQRFDQSDVPIEELTATFNAYFAIFPWHELPDQAKGFDLGCGSGRWAKLVAPRVGELHCIDASQVALEVAKRNLAGCPNCKFHHADVGAIPVSDASMDFGYSLGVLHHIPDTQAGLAACAAKLKRGAPFLVYLYYAFDNRPKWFKALWKVADYARRGLSKAPYAIKYAASQLIAIGAYFPLATVSRVLEGVGLNVKDIPLSSYRNKSFYTMRTDAFDRFATRLEQRYTKDQIARMMQRAGLVDIRFADQVPHWCAVGRKA